MKFKGKITQIEGSGDLLFIQIKVDKFIGEHPDIKTLIEKDVEVNYKTKEDLQESKGGENGN